MMIRLQLLSGLIPLIAHLCAVSALADNTTVIGPNPSLQAGAHALQLGQFEPGIRLTLEGLGAETEPRARAKALSNLCAGYVGLGQFARATEHCDAALRLRPRDWRAFNNRALARLGQQKWHAALADVQQGLAINPDARSLRRSLDLIRAARSRQVLTAAVSTVTE